MSQLDDLARQPAVPSQRTVIDLAGAERQLAERRRRRERVLLELETARALRRRRRLQRQA